MQRGCVSLLLSRQRRRSLHAIVTSRPTCVRFRRRCTCACVRSNDEAGRYAVINSTVNTKWQQQQAKADAQLYNDVTAKHHGPSKGPAGGSGGKKDDAQRYSWSQYPRDAGLRAQLLQADALAAKGQHEQALKAYQ